MSAITQVPFYPSDWLAGTRGMTAAQMGVYITLVAMMYERAGPVRCDDMAKLVRLCGTSASALKGLLEDLIFDGKVTREGDLLSNRRAMLEIENVMAKSEVARDKANARWQKKPEKSKADECIGIAPAMQAISHKPLDTSSLRSDVERVNAPETPKAEKLKPEKREDPSMAFAGVLSDDLAKAVVAHRKAKGAPLTPVAAKLLADAFRKTGKPQEAAEMMILQGWQGFKPSWFANQDARAGPSHDPPRQMRGSAALNAALDRILPDAPHDQAIPHGPVLSLSRAG
jgi:uncharacterized protein YdaU (DUF1376 family)